MILQKTILRRIVTFLAGSWLLVSSPFVGTAQSPRKITLAEAIDIALKNNHGIQISNSKIDEMRYAKRAAASDYRPKLSNSSAYDHFTQRDALQFSAGAFGTLPGIGSLPKTDLIVQQGSLNQLFSRTQLAQPLTQLIKIHDANRIAQAGFDASLNDLRQQQLQIALGVRQLYYGLLIAQADQMAAASQESVAAQSLAESQQDVTKGNALEVETIGARASVLQSKQQALQARMQESDLKAEFNDVLGLPLDTALYLDDTPEPPITAPGKEECIKLAQAAEPEIRSAEDTIKKARAAIAAARAEYIPDLTAFARYDYQDGVPFLFHNYGVLGLSFSYDLFEGGKRHAVLRERQAQLAQAEENVRRLKDEAAVNIQKALDNLEQSKQMIDVAQQALALRQEGDRLAEVQLGYGAIMRSKRLDAIASLSKAKADLLRAELAHSLSQAELQILLGQLPR